MALPGNQHTSKVVCEHVCNQLDSLRLHMQNAELTREDAETIAQRCSDLEMAAFGRVTIAVDLAQPIRPPTHHSLNVEDVR
jgi:hypothetical protein